MILNKGDVFNVTAVDPDVLRHVFETSPYEEVKVYSSIVSIKPSQLKDKFIFTEKETIRAMMIVGATTDDLIIMSEFDKRKIPGTPRVRRKIIEELEERRLKIFSSIVEERNNLLNKSKINNTPKNKQNAFSSKQSSNKAAKNHDYDKLKQKHLNSLISYQTRKNQLQKSEEAAATRLEELKKSKTIEMQKKKMRSYPQTTKKEKIEQFKERKEEEIKKARDELQTLENSLSSTSSKKVIKEKKTQIEALKNKINEDETNLMKTEEAESNANSTAQFIKKEDVKLLILKEKEKKILNEKLILEKKLFEKDARIEANLKLISSQRMKHIRENQIMLKKRSQSAAATKKILEQQRLERLQKSLIRQEEAIERAKQLKASKTTSLLEKAGENWIKQKNGNDKAKKIFIQKRYKDLEKVEKTIEKQNELKEMKDQAEIKKIKELRTATIRKVKQREEYDKLKREILIDPDADPTKLAEKYKIDISTVNKMPDEKLNES